MYNSHGQWTLNKGKVQRTKTIDNEQKTMNNEQKTMDNEQKTMDNEQNKINMDNRKYLFSFYPGQIYFVLTSCGWKPSKQIKGGGKVLHYSREVGGGISLTERRGGGGYKGMKKGGDKEFPHYILILINFLLIGTSLRLIYCNAIYFCTRVENCRIWEQFIAC